jgi:hypothetical protein
MRVTIKITSELPKVPDQKLPDSGELNNELPEVPTHIPTTSVKEGKEGTNNYRIVIIKSNLTIKSLKIDAPRKEKQAMLAN